MRIVRVAGRIERGMGPETMVTLVEAQTSEGPVVGIRVGELFIPTFHTLHPKAGETLAVGELTADKTILRASKHEIEGVRRQLAGGRTYYSQALVVVDLPQAQECYLTSACWGETEEGSRVVREHLPLSDSAGVEVLYMAGGKALLACMPGARFVAHHPTKGELHVFWEGSYLSAVQGARPPLKAKGARPAKGAPLKATLGELTARA